MRFKVPYRQSDRPTGTTPRTPLCFSVVATWAFSYFRGGNDNQRSTDCQASLPVSPANSFFSKRILPYTAPAAFFFFLVCQPNRI